MRYYKSLSKSFWILLLPAFNLRFQAENNPDDAEAELSLDMKVCASSIISQPNPHHIHCHDHYLQGCKGRNVRTMVPLQIETKQVKNGNLS